MEKLDNISSLNFSKHYIPILGTLKLQARKPEDRLVLSLSKGEMIVLAIPVIINNNISKSFKHYSFPFIKFKFICQIFECVIYFFIKFSLYYQTD